jgi:flagellar hook capping protein FlgD
MRCVPVIQVSLARSFRRSPPRSFANVQVPRTTPIVPRRRSCPSLIRNAHSWFRFLWLAVTLLPWTAGAVELAPGDMVLFSTGWPCGIYRLDPVTLAPTQISDCLGFGGGAHHMTVDRRGRLFVTDEARGIVEVSPATGARSVLMPVETLGGPPRGIGKEADGMILVTLQTTPPRLVRIDADTRALKIVTEGGLLIAPTGVDVAPDGAILVADQNARVNPITNLQSVGGLVRVDPGTGAQTLVAADPSYYFPQDLVCMGGDSVWLVNKGRTLRSIGGVLTITRLSDGVTAEAPVGFFNSQGIALLSNGSIAYSGCQPVSGDCQYPYVAVYGSGASLGGYMGTLAVVPEREIPKAAVLAPAMPNPFAASTALSFSLAKTGAVELAIYSVDGRRVATLEDGTLAAGPHKVTWGGMDASGRMVRPGVYFARLRSAEGGFARTLMLIR